MVNVFNTIFKWESDGVWNGIDYIFIDQNAGVYIVHFDKNPHPP